VDIPDEFKEQAEPAFVLSALADGPHTLYAQVIDDGGEASVWISRSFTYEFPEDKKPEVPPVIKNIFGQEFVYIPAGEFIRGSATDEGDDNEQPQQKIYLDAYYMGKYEVTFEEYDRFCEETGRQKPDDEGWGRGKRPVINVSWYDAVAYSKWLSKKTGEHYRLPTEAEWEKAARGTDGRKYPWGNTEPTRKKCNFDNQEGRTMPVGSYESGLSPYQLYDIAGNVWEWCQDWYAEDYYAHSSKNNPQGPPIGDYRVLRGGSWSNNIYEMRCTNRNWASPAIGLYNRGFRLVRVP